MAIRPASCPRMSPASRIWTASVRSCRSSLRPPDPWPIIGCVVGEPIPQPPVVEAPDPLAGWSAFLGTTLAGASLGLVALADFGWYSAPLALLIVAAAGAGAALLWRPPLWLPTARL